MDHFFWSIILLLLGFVIVAAELFIPSGGALGVVATIALLAAIILGFKVSVNLGLIYIIIIAVIVPFLIVALLRLWPHTSLGKRLLVQPPTDDKSSPAARQQQQLKQLVGQLGTAKTKMLPSGIIAIGTQSYDAVGEGSSIEPGQTIRVKRVEMNYLVVELYDGIPSSTPPGPTPANPPGSDPQSLSFPARANPNSTTPSPRNETLENFTFD